MNDLRDKADVSVLIIFLTGPSSISYSEAKPTGKDFIKKLQIARHGVTSIIQYYKLEVAQWSWYF